MSTDKMRMVKTTHEKATELFEALAAKEDMAGWSKNAEYYFVLYNEVIAGVTSLQYWSTKIKFNNHYVYKEYRGKGLFKFMFEFSMKNARFSRCKYIEATCTSMSIDHYLKNGFQIVKEFKLYYGVKYIL